MTKTEYYWMDDSDFIVVGAFATEAEARETALDSAGSENNHKRTYTILKVVAKSKPPTLKRTWR